MHRAKARKLENGEPFEMNDGDVRCWGKDLPDDDSAKIFRDLSLSYLIVCLRIEMKNVDSRGKKSCQKIHSMQIFPDSHPMTFRDWSLTLCRLLGNQKVSTEYFVYATRTLRGKMFSLAMVDYADAKFDEKFSKRERSLIPCRSIALFDLVKTRYIKIRRLLQAHHELLNLSRSTYCWNDWRN